jgi:hypothetical protein
LINHGNLILTFHFLVPAAQRIRIYAAFFTQAGAAILAIHRIIKGNGATLPAGIARPILK